jgi:hypothetical protein
VADAPGHSDCLFGRDFIGSVMSATGLSTTCQLGSDQAIDQIEATLSPSGLLGAFSRWR